MYFFDRSLPYRTTLLTLVEIAVVLTVLVSTIVLSGEQTLISMTASGVEASLVGGILLLCLYFVDFYEPPVTTQRAQSVSRIIQSVGLTLLIIAPFPQMLVPTLDNPAPVFLGMMLTGICLSTSRCVFAEVARRPKLSESAVIWGSGDLAANIIQELNKRPEIGIRIVGVVDYSYPRALFAGVRYLGSPEIMWTMENSTPVRRIIVAINERRGSFPFEKLMAVKAGGLSVEDGAELYEELTGKVWLGSFSITKLLFSKKLQPSPMKLLVKRFFSVLFAAIALLLSSPVMLITALLIHFDSAGPVIFRQVRVGENGRHFTLFKFRSMKVGASECAPAIHNDPRCTRVGRWIRRLRIDELPQLFNILRGDMYFVGPRPFLPDQEESFAHQIPYYRQRWAVRPGATGWAQVHREYCASIEDNVEKLSYDLFYIKNLSLALDLLTVLKTVKVLLLGRGGR